MWGSAQPPAWPLAYLGWLLFDRKALGSVSLFAGFLERPPQKNSTSTLHIGPRFSLSEVPSFLSVRNCKQGNGEANHALVNEGDF